MATALRSRDITLGPLRSEPRTEPRPIPVASPRVHVDFADGVIRKYDSAIPDPSELPSRIVAFRSFPEGDSVDVSDVTQDIRSWLLGRHHRFEIEERRKFVDIGASASNVEFVLTLFGSAAAQVALEQIVAYVRDRLDGTTDDEWRAQRFREAATEQLRDEALSTAERLLEFRRGELTAVAFDRGDVGITLEARRGPDERFRITLAADESITVEAIQP